MKSKKATILSFISDNALGWTIFVIGMIFWVVVFMYGNSQKKIEINEKVAYLSNTEVLNSILRYQVLEGVTYGDIAIESYLTKDNDRLSLATKSVLEPVYNKGDSICWRIYFDNTLFAKEDCGKIFETPFLDSNVTLSLPVNSIKKTVNFRIEIPGLKK
ncbi:MAG: hypothetical protein V1859_06095 [archaeon]